MAYYSAASGYSDSVGVRKKKNILAAVAATAVALGLMLSLHVNAAGGFDKYGYNDKARVFVGAADGVDKKLDGAVWGDSTYAADHLVMKWNKAWDDCNAAGNDDETACAGAWTTNQWNGMGGTGSNSTYSYKMIWVGSDGESSRYWKDGGYLLWDNYEVISEQGMDGGEHYMMKAVAPGLGQKKLN